ncbi:helix-turn-helix domain-containing protein [Paenibacillus rigui]|uniref:AraC family transcriptional regulator n=1 Tax=Paenibacillus rigui TaxID=554312 RepID=A0A229UIY4_9BACL|nr:helix-turn-helix domain-containing protein [Paenibacillus rigui]OXM83418.1 AraC family transcriptional regulator [Paenibacillus rigui]
MNTTRYSEIDEVISFIHENIYDPLPLSRLASYAAYSPYHFSRIFKERMGLSPLYYVSAMRLHKAKDLLLRTNLSVRDIGLEVGQQSLGTFTTRFTEKVGVTPSEFRNSKLQANNPLQMLQEMNLQQTSFSNRSRQLCVEGSIHSDVPFKGVVLIGLFAKPIPEGLPLYGTLASSEGSFRFSNVKPGTYYLMATSVSWEMQAMDILLPQTTLRTRSRTPIVVTPHSQVPYQQVILYPPSPDDPPILVSLPVLMNNYIAKAARHSSRNSNR